MRPRTFARCRFVVVLLLVAVATFFMPTLARAQRAADVVLSPIDVSIAATINGLAHNTFDGFGLDVAIARNVSERAAFATDLSTSARVTTGHAVSLLAGPRINSGFFYAGDRDREPGRFFGQVLVGGELTDVLRPVVLIGGGTDVIVRKNSSRGIAPGPAHDLTLRMALDYRFVPGAGRHLSGYRFVLGVVFGPQLSGSGTHGHAEARR